MADLIMTARKENGWSLRQVAGWSNGLVSASRLHTIEQGAIPADDRILVGIAAALDLPLADVRAAAGRSRATPLPPFRLPAQADQLTERERKAVLAVVGAMLAAHRQ